MLLWQCDVMLCIISHVILSVIFEPPLDVIQGIRLCHSSSQGLRKCWFFGLRPVFEELDRFSEEHQKFGP